jgi:hypothetical protein
MATDSKHKIENTIFDVQVGEHHHLKIHWEDTFLEGAEESESETACTCQGGITELLQNQTQGEGESALGRAALEPLRCVREEPSVISLLRCCSCVWRLLWMHLVGQRAPSQ